MTDLKELAAGQPDLPAQLIAAVLACVTVREGKVSLDVNDARSRILAVMGLELPCDVKLPPSTTIRAGCKFSTLLRALALRQHIKETDSHD